MEVLLPKSHFGNNFVFNKRVVHLSMPFLMSFRNINSTGLLVEDSTLPQWVFHKDTLQFLDVNEAAIALYGYSRNEFLAMTVADIRPVFDKPKLARQISIHYDKVSYQDVWKHKKKNGDILFVIVSAIQQIYKGIPVWVVTITDFTATLKRYSKDNEGGLSPA